MEEFSSFNKAIVSNLVSEFGDKTFILSAILAMKYNGVLVFIGSSLGFILMTFLGSVVGYMIPQLFSVKIVRNIGGIIFMYFGQKILRKQFFLNKIKSLEKSKNQNTNQQTKENDDSSSSSDVEEDIQKMNSQISENNKQKKSQLLKNLSIIFQTFAQVFFGEFGDRSQITTIALASTESIYQVFFGSIIGQLICTLVAVIIGRYIYKRIPKKYINIGNGLLFVYLGVTNITF